MRVVSLLCVLMASFASEARSEVPYLHLGVDRGTGQGAGPDDALLTVQVTQGATGRFFACSETIGNAVILCPAPSDAFLAKGDYSIAVTHSPGSSGPWMVPFTLPEGVLSVELSGAIGVGGSRPGIMMGDARVLVVGEELAQVHRRDVPPSKRGGADDPRVVFEFTNGSAKRLLLESIDGRPIGRLYREAPSGALERYISPLDECFGLLTEYATKVKPGASVMVRPASLSDQLVTGKYVFVVQYRRPGARPLWGRHGAAVSEVRHSFTVE